MKKLLCTLLCLTTISCMTACNTKLHSASNDKSTSTSTNNNQTKKDGKNLGSDLISAAQFGTPIKGIPEITPEEEEAWKKEPAYNKTIKVGYNGGLCLGGFGIAQMKGFYKAEGLKTEITKMQSQTDALGTGQIDIAGDHIATLLVPAVNGVKMTFTTGIHTGCQTLYALANGPIKSTKDLVGKTVAVPDGIGGSCQNITFRFFNHDKIDPTSVKYKVVETSACILAMQNGEIDAATFSDQYAKPFMDDGTIVPIRSLTFDEDFKQEPCCIHAVNSDFIKSNPITVKKLNIAFEKASNWMLQNPQEAVKILQDNKWASGDFATTLQIFKTYNFGISDDLTETSLTNIINDYKSFGLIEKSKSTDELMSSVWDRVLSSKQQ